MASNDRRRALSVLSILMAAGLAGCATTSGGGSFRNLSARECLARVMYFESNRSSEDGMLAVGTVVMNRRDSGKYPGTVCGVVGERNQFADGALYKRMSGPSRDRAEQVADRVLAGERHPGVGSAMFFHTAGYHYPYNNMHYVVVAGGNAFYEKRKPGTFTPGLPPVSAPAFRPVMVSSASSIDTEDRVRLSMFLATGNGLN